MNKELRKRAIAFYQENPEFGENAITNNLIDFALSEQKLRIQEIRENLPKHIGFLEAATNKTGTHWHGFRDCIACLEDVLNELERETPEAKTE